MDNAKALPPLHNYNNKIIVVLKSFYITVAKLFLTYCIPPILQHGESLILIDI
jgi:hypothetical protein